MTVTELINILKSCQDPDTVVVCEDESGGWDNIQRVALRGSSIAIVFGGGSPFSDEGPSKEP